MIRFYNGQLRALAFTFALAIVAGCGDDDDTTGGGPVDTTPPSVSSVAAVDAGHIDITFNENVQRGSAEASSNYVIVEVAPLTMASAPGDTLAIVSASLATDNRTVSLTTEPMLATPYELGVNGVKDASGNAIVTPVVRAFTGSTDPDVTAPELVYRSPGPNQTGVALGTQILLTFSELITENSFISGFTLSVGAVDVPYSAFSNDGVHVVVTPNSPLEFNTEYTIALTGIEDLTGNVMPDASWTFRTTNVADTTPPTLVSSIPANGATNVDVNATLSITFSEPVNHATIQLSLYPEVLDGYVVWSNGGKTITFTPTEPFIDDQQYTLSAIPGSFEDLAGNTNTQFTQIRFSTGNALATGSFAGTLSGDPASDFAGDPSGARVFAADTLLEDPVLAGSGLVAGNDTYNVQGLADAPYFALSVMDSNDDGVLDPNLGDAIGVYGVDFDIFDLTPEIITITGGNHVTGIDFQLVDFSAITGSLSYSGAVGGSHFVGIGLFETAGFDPTDSPVYTTDAQWPGFPEWGFLNFADAIPDGSYYVGAFLDANDNAAYDVGTDPAGFYGGLPPTAVTITNGSDANGIVIPLEDPPVALATASIAWRGQATRRPPAWFSQLSKAIAESEGRQPALSARSPWRNSR